MLPFISSSSGSQKPKQSSTASIMKIGAPKSSFDPKFCQFLGTLQTEFKQLLSDSHSPLVTKKKQAEIKVVRDKIEAVVAWCDGVQQGTIHLALVQASIEGFQNKIAGPGVQQTAEFVDENMTIFMDALFAIVESNKLHKIYLPILNILQRLLMSVQSRGPDHKSQAESNQFRMSQECRERMLTLLTIITQQEQTATQLDEMQHLKLLQILMIFLDPNQSDKISKRFVNHVFKICFQLFELKAIKGTSSSSSMHAGAPGIGNIAIRSTLQASLRQLLSLVIDSFNREVEAIIGTQIYKDAFQIETGQYQRVSQVFIEKQDQLQNSLIVQVVEDLLQNLATALFIHEQASHDNGLGGSSTKKGQNSNSSGAMIGGIMGSISNQHIWNFKPSIQTSCSVLDILSLIMDQTGSLFVYFPRICKVFENQMIPTIIQMLKSLSGEASQGIRVVKSLVCILVNLSCTSHFIHDDNQLSSQSSQRSEVNSALSGQDNINEQSSQRSGPRQSTQAGLVYRTCEFQHLDQIIQILTYIASIDNVLNQTRNDKEVSSSNVHQIIAKITWNHLIGLEAFSQLYRNRAIVAKLSMLENGKAIIASLDAMMKIVNFIKLLDHKHGFNMMSQSFSSHGTEDILNLNTFQMAAGSGQNQQLINSSQANFKSKKVQASQGHYNQSSNFSLQDKLVVPKIIEEIQQFQAEDDLMVLRYMLGPANIQRLLQECIVGLVESFVDNSKQTESLFYNSTNLNLLLQKSVDQLNKNDDQTLQNKDTRDRAIPKIWSSSVMVDGGNVKKQAQDISSKISNNDGSDRLLIQAAPIINSILEKLYYSIQKNQALFLEEKMKDEQIAYSLQQVQIDQLKAQQHQANSSNQILAGGSVSNTNSSGKQITSYKVTVPYALHSQMVLQSLSGMAEMLHYVGLSDHRDQFIRTLCGMCTSRQVTFMKADPNKGQYALSGQPSEGSNLASAKHHHTNGFLLKIEQPMVSLNNVLACQTLISLINKTNYFRQSEKHLQQIQQSNLRSRKAYSFIDVNKGNQGANNNLAQSLFSQDKQHVGELSTASSFSGIKQSELQAGLRDLEMWQCIIDTIGRLDSSISMQLEDTGMFTTSGKRVGGGPISSARTSAPSLTSVSAKFGASGPAGIDGQSGLIDFAKFKIKVQQYKTNQLLKTQNSGRTRINSDGGTDITKTANSKNPSHLYGQKQEQYDFKNYQSIGTALHTQGLSTHREGIKSLDLSKLGAPEVDTSSQYEMDQLQSTQGIFSIDETGIRNLNFNVTLRKVWLIDGYKCPSKIEMGTLRLALIDSQNAKIPAYCSYLPLKQDLEALQKSLDSIIQQSDGCSAVTLHLFGSAFQNCLNELVGSKSNVSLSQSYTETFDVAVNSVPVRLIERFMELTLFNLSNIDLIWNQFVKISAILQQSPSQKHQALKLLSIEIIQLLIQQYFQFQKTKPQLQKLQSTSVDKASIQQNRQQSDSNLQTLAKTKEPETQIQDLSPDFLQTVPGNPEELNQQQKELSEPEMPVTVEIDDVDLDQRHDGNLQNKPIDMAQSNQNYFDSQQQNDNQSRLRLEVGDDWKGTMWQATILQPLTNVMASPSASDKLMALKSIEKVIQLCGQGIKSDGWKIIIQNIARASEIGALDVQAFENVDNDFDTYSTSTRRINTPSISAEAQKLEQQVAQYGFKCLKLIINNYIYLLDQENFISIFQCIQIFSQQDNENINTNLIAVGMFMNIADFNAKQTRSAFGDVIAQNSAAIDEKIGDSDAEKQCESIDVDLIWKQLFQRMQTISRECKAEVRRSLIQTLENIITNYGQIICMDVWGMLLHKILLGMVKHSSDMFNKSCQRSEAQEIQSSAQEKFVGSNQISDSNQRSSTLNPSLGVPLDFMPSTDAEGETGVGDQIFQNQADHQIGAYSTNQQYRHSVVNSVETLQTHSVLQQVTSKRKQMAFDDEKVMKALQDNDEQSWSETSIQLISSTYRAIKIYLALLQSENKQQINPNQSKAIVSDQSHNIQYQQQDIDLGQSSNLSSEVVKSLSTVRYNALKKIWKEYHAILGSLINNSTQPESQINKTTLMVLQQIFTYQEDFLKIVSNTSEVSNLNSEDQSDVASIVPNSHEFYFKQFDCQVLLLQKIKDWVDIENQNFEGVIQAAQANQQRFVNRNKSLILKVTPDIVQYLSKMFSQSMIVDIKANTQIGTCLNNLQLNSPDTIEILLSLVCSLQNGCKMIGEGLNQPGRPYKPLHEEQILYSFIDQLNDVCYENQESQKQYLQFIIDSIEYKGCKFSESRTKQHLQILKTIITENRIFTALIPWLIDEMFIKFKKLLSLRYDWSLCRNLVYFNSSDIAVDQTTDKDQQNIVQIAAQYILQISSFFLESKSEKEVDDNSNKSKSEEQQNTPKNQLSIDQKESIEQQLNEKDSDNSIQVKKQIWIQIMNLLENDIIFDLGKFDQMKSGSQRLQETDEHLFIQLLKESQQIDLLAIDFVVNNMLTFCSQLKSMSKEQQSMELSPIEMENTLICFIDQSCQNALLGTQGSVGNSKQTIGTLQFFKKFNVLQGKAYSQVGGSLTHNNLKCLFDLCKLSLYESQQIQKKEDNLLQNQQPQKTDQIENTQKVNQSDLNQMKEKISKMAHPILTQKCKEILRQFTQDEFRYGSMKLPHARNNQIIFVLKELKILSEMQIVRQKQENNNREQQNLIIVDLMPILSELIISQSDEIRSHLKQIFLIISNQLANKAI